MCDKAIRIEDLSKLYHIGEHQGSYKTLRETIVKAFSVPFRNLCLQSQSPIYNPQSNFIWALKDISFEVKRGKVVGIIGRNGAGKTTLLKILSRITEPTEGRAEIRGRVGSLLEVGTGFHPELTGRENIYLNGAILGMKKGEIARKFDEIVAFAEIEKFIDTPVKRYSNGMYVRLAFAVAAHLEPEILLVDEVLAVGDAAFQKKCLGKMGNVAREGRTVLFVSHNMGAVRRLCDETIWIDQGKVVVLGTTDSAVDQYLSSNEQGGGEFRVNSLYPAPGDGRVRLLAVFVKNQRGEVTDTIDIESTFSLELEYELSTCVENLRVGLNVIASDGTVVFSSADTDPEGLGISREPGIYVSKCTIPSNLLNCGRYYVTAACDRPMQERLFLVENIVSFTVQLTGGVGGSVPEGRLGVIRPLLKWDVHCARNENSRCHIK